MWIIFEFANFFMFSVADSHTHETSFQDVFRRRQTRMKLWYVQAQVWIGSSKSWSWRITSALPFFYWHAQKFHETKEIFDRLNLDLLQAEIWAKCSSFNVIAAKVSNLFKRLFSLSYIGRKFWYYTTNKQKFHFT